MLDLIIFIKAAGPNIREDNLFDTLTSLRKRVGIENYGFYLVVEQSMLNSVKRADIDSKILEIKFVNSDSSWAVDYNLFLDKYLDKTRWILISHDDLTVDTDNFFEKMILPIANKEVGWIVSTSDYYYKHEGLPIACTGRTGFFKDRNNFVYECHKFGKKHWGDTKQNLHLIDMPDINQVVKIFGPMSDFMMVSSESMKKIGYCEDWTKYTMLVDEDWALTAQKNNLHNVWVPNVFHTHPLRKQVRPTGNKWEKEARAGFLKKWDFEHPYSEETIKLVRERFKDTLIPWSSYKNSYEWEYLNEK